MKSTVRALANRVAHLPVVGRIVRMGVAIVRGPNMLDRLDALERNATGAVDRLRALEGYGTSAVRFFDHQLPEMLRTLSEVHHAQNRIDVDEADLRRSVPIALRALRREATQIAEQLRGLDAKAAQMASLQEVGDLKESVGYLLGRVEYVRREVMFELRYGASSEHMGDEKAEISPEVLSPEKLEAARSSGLRLNLGCGHVPIDGFLNVDRRALPGVDIVADVDKLPFDLGELKEVFSSHLLEHFPQEQLRRSLLPYFFGLLKPDGQLRSIVPDAEAMLKHYGEGSYPYEDLREVLYGGQDYDGDFHFNMLTPKSLAELMEEAGFVDICVVDRGRRNGRCYEFEIVGSKPRESGA